MEKYSRSLKTPARRLRSNLTDAEQALWARLRRKQVRGLQFYRQKPLLSYIVDFYCPKAKLVIELDGSQHFEETHQEKDRERDARLAELGVKVLRFDNRQVLKEMDAVMEVIFREIPPGPPLVKGGGYRGNGMNLKQSLCQSPPLKKGDLGGFLNCPSTRPSSTFPLTAR